MLKSPFKVFDQTLASFHPRIVRVEGVVAHPIPVGTVHETFTSHGSYDLWVETRLAFEARNPLITSIQLVLGVVAIFAFLLSLFSLTGSYSDLSGL